MYGPPAVIDPRQQDSPYQQQHRNYHNDGFYPSAAGSSGLMGNPNPGPVDPQAFNYQGRTGSMAPSFASGLNAPWAASGGLDINKNLKPPSPAGLTPPPDPASVNTNINVQQTKQPWPTNPPWTEAEVETLKRLAAEGVGYTDIHKREVSDPSTQEPMEIRFAALTLIRHAQFADTRTAKAVQMKYYALKNGGKRRRGSGKGQAKAKSNEE